MDKNKAMNGPQKCTYKRRVSLHSLTAYVRPAEWVTSVHQQRLLFVGLLERNLPTRTTKTYTRFCSGIRVSWPADGLEIGWNLVIAVFRIEQEIQKTGRVLTYFINCLI